MGAADQWCRRGVLALEVCYAFGWQCVVATCTSAALEVCLWRDSQAPQPEEENDLGGGVAVDMPATHRGVAL